ncbi:hypothetical protein I5K77_31150, partial [Pseudomonas aeruginosa]|nr:hypothetical protein [Pseudomonas aeruginosa]
AGNQHRGRLLPGPRAQGRGARGGHARAAVGVAELPRGAAVEVELIAAVRP